MNIVPRVNLLVTKAATLHTSAGVTGAISATAALTAIVAIIILLTLPAAAVVAPIIAISGGGIALLALVSTIALLYNKYITLDRIRFIQKLNTQTSDEDNPQTCDSDEDNPTTMAQIESTQPSPSVNEDPLIARVNANDHSALRDFLLMQGIGRLDADLDECQNTLLIWAAYNGHYEIVKALIENGADVCHLSVEGISALMSAACSGDKRIVQLLIDNGANVNQQTNKGPFALMSAAREGHVDVVQLLINNGANVNQEAKDGATALRVATGCGHIDVVKLLLSCGAKHCIIKDGNLLSSPYAVALYRGHHQIAEILKARLTSEELLAFQEALALKAVGHSTHQEGNVTFGESMHVALEGASGSGYWLKKMIKCTELLLQNRSTPFLRGEAKKLISLLTNAAVSSTDAAWTRYKNGQPSLIMTGCESHTSCALIWGPYFLLCDRGGVSRVPLKMYKFDPKKINQSFFKQLSEFKSLESYRHLLKEWQPLLLRDSFSRLFSDNCPFEMQKVGNCSMACIEVAVWAFLALNKLFSGKDGAFDETIKPQNSAITEALNQTTEKVRDWLLYYQIYLLERYIGVRVLRSQDPEKIKKSKEKRKAIELNYDFYTSTMDYLARELEKRKQRQNQITTDEDPLENALIALSKGLSSVL